MDQAQEMANEAANDRQEEKYQGVKNTTSNTVVHTEENGKNIGNDEAKFELQDVNDEKTIDQYPTDLSKSGSLAQLNSVSKSKLKQPSAANPGTS